MAGCSGGEGKGERLFHPPSLVPGALLNGAIPEAGGCGWRAEGVRQWRWGVCVCDVALPLVQVEPVAALPTVDLEISGYQNQWKEA